MDTGNNVDRTIQLRASQADRALIDRAAEIAGMNHAQFMLRAARKDAKEVIVDHAPLADRDDALCIDITKLWR